MDEPNQQEDEYVRFECLRFATDSGCCCDDLILKAQELFDFVKSGPKAAQVIKLHEVTH